MRNFVLALAAVAGLSAAVPANAVNFSALYNTGVTNSWGYAVGNNGGNSSYSYIGAAQVVTNPVWFANTATSSWIAPSSSGTAASGYYIYGENFNASNVQSGDTLNFKFAADDVVTRILLNGNVVYTGNASGSDYSAFQSLAISGLTNGQNIIQFETLNNGGNTTNPSGFRAEFANASAVPEPKTWAMMLAGFGLMGVALRNRRRVSALAL